MDVEPNVPHTDWDLVCPTYRLRPGMHVEPNVPHTDWDLVCPTYRLRPGMFHIQTETWYVPHTDWDLVCSTYRLRPGMSHIQTETWYVPHTDWDLVCPTYRLRPGMYVEPFSTTDNFQGRFCLKVYVLQWACYVHISLLGVIVLKFQLILKTELCVCQMLFIVTCDIGTNSTAINTQRKCELIAISRTLYKIEYLITTNTRHWTNVGTMLGHRLLHWSNKRPKVQQLCINLFKFD